MENKAQNEAVRSQQNQATQTRDVKVTRAVAQNEMNKWLDFKKIKAKKREGLAESIEEVIDSIEDGTLRLDEDKKLIQDLSFPLEGVSELVFKPRIQAVDINAALKGIKMNDNNGRVIAYISALTGRPKTLISKLDTEDMSIGNTLAVFFI